MQYAEKVNTNTVYFDHLLRRWWIWMSTTIIPMWYVSFPMKWAKWNCWKSCRLCPLCLIFIKVLKKRDIKAVMNAIFLFSFISNYELHYTLRNIQLSRKNVFHRSYLSGNALNYNTAKLFVIKTQLICSSKNAVKTEKSCRNEQTIDSLS